MQKELEQVRYFNELGKQDVGTSPRWISVKDFDKQVMLIEEELEELGQAYDDRDPIEVTDALVDITYVLFGMVTRFGLQQEFVKAFQLVHENNMSKVVDKDGNNIAIFNEAGKIIKPEGFVPVDLKTQFNYLNNMLRDE